MITATKQVKIMEIAKVLTDSPWKRKCSNRAVRHIVCHFRAPELVSSKWIDCVSTRARKIRLLIVCATVVHSFTLFAEMITQRLSCSADCQPQT